MTKKCIYCGKEVSDEAVIDFCDMCGERVWGKKMFETIKKNMEDARDRGDLCISLQKDTTVSPPKKF